MNKKILLFYKYVALANPEQVKQEQLSLCISLNLTGRIILATEGINGTLCGTEEQADAYVLAMRQNKYFADIDFKESMVNPEHEYFHGLQVAVKKEIVRLGIDPEALPASNHAQHISPEQAHELIAKQLDDVVLLDGRNDYEARVGTFQGAIVPPVQHFRDFPAYIDNNLELFKDKQVVMFCTGGIRCERASAYLASKNVAKNVVQIEGGIHRYVEKFPDGFFRGKNYVFDARIAVKVNDDVLSSCDLCSTSCDDFYNCQNASCNKQFIACKLCIEKTKNCCSEHCLNLLEQKICAPRPARMYVSGQQAQPIEK